MTAQRRARSTASKRLLPPKGGAVVRMYRTGHGDCFLLAFAGKSAAKPVYVLIDCGYKPGSSSFIKTTIGEITGNLREATGGRIDVAIVTHEHQDHVNGITEKNFAGIEIGETWLAWTEDPRDDLANALRKRYRDRLLGLIRARNRLQADGDAKRVATIDALLALELGGADERFDAAAALRFAAAKGESGNKASMKLLKDRAARGVRYLRPHEKVLAIEGAPGVRVFAFGPPRDETLLKDLDPRDEEEFHRLGATADFEAAARGEASPPFPGRYCVAQDAAFGDPEFGDFFVRRYGRDGSAPSGAGDDRDVADDAAWRRIDRDWLYSAEQLALDLNSYTNNSSLVLAFELNQGGKVLLFAADAQRGNWVSWGKKAWTDGDRTVTARELLGRTVLYKVGHHGSHNATMNGALEHETPNLAWMATGDHADEFVAMIPAVKEWANTKAGWDHPLKAIKDALVKKASGRVFQTDTDVATMRAPDGVSKKEWSAFLARATDHRLYFDWIVRG
jgi:Predicted hydrolase (metallo-beta-lactamase superfamily)